MYLYLNGYKIVIKIQLFLIVQQLGYIYLCNYGYYKMKISINGKMQSFDKEVLTFETLIKEINFAGRRFAIESND